MSAVEVFAPQWTARLAEELNSDSEYRLAASEWNGVLGLAMDLAGEARRIAILDLEAGHCRRSGNDPESLPPDYVIEGDASTWKSVFDGGLEPMWGLMSGKLRLSRGSLAQLAPQSASAIRIVECARRIPSTFPGDNAPAQTVSKAQCRIEKARDSTLEEVERVNETPDETVS